MTLNPQQKKDADERTSSPESFAIRFATGLLLSAGLLAFGSSAALGPSRRKKAAVTGFCPRVPTRLAVYSYGIATESHRVPGC